MTGCWQDKRTGEYDLMFVCCGYEARCTFVHDQFEGKTGRLVILDYGSPGVHSYDRNRLELERSASANWVDLRQADFDCIIAEWIARTCSDLERDGPVRVLFDISSCSRSTMASVLINLAHNALRDVDLTCVYAVSAYFNPPDGELPSSVSEPVIGELSGWSSDLTKPPCAIIGLGFEPGRALGSIDYLEVPEVRLFVPEGPDGRFHEAVVEANRHLLDDPGIGSSAYHVLNPIDTYQKLESMILGLLPRYRPIIIPLGPKIFAAISMLIAIRMLPQVCIWRTSAGSGEDTADRAAGGDIAAFNYLMRCPGS
jgi:hypothetical protein